MNRPVVVFFDATVQPKSPGGYGCAGWWIVNHPGVPGLEEDREGLRCYGQGPQMEIGAIEYRAATSALNHLALLGYDGPVVLHGDSQTVVQQFRGDARCLKPRMQLNLAYLRGQASRFTSCEMIWVPRKENRYADELARQAYRMARRIEMGVAA